MVPRNENPKPPGLQTTKPYHYLTSSIPPFEVSKLSTECRGRSKIAGGNRFRKTIFWKPFFSGSSFRIHPWSSYLLLVDLLSIFLQNHFQGLPDFCPPKKKKNITSQKQTSQQAPKKVMFQNSKPPEGSVENACFRGSPGAQVLPVPRFFTMAQPRPC